MGLNCLLSLWELSACTYQQCVPSGRKSECVVCNASDDECESAQVNHLAAARVLFLFCSLLWRNALVGCGSWTGLGFSQWRAVPGTPCGAGCSHVRRFLRPAY